MENIGISAPYFQLILNGTDLSKELMPSIQGIKFEDELNLPAMLTINFTMVDFEKGTWKGIDLETFKPGDEIKLSMGIDQAVKMMAGEITSFDLSFGEPCTLEIRSYDRLHRLRFGTRTHSFKDAKDSDIAASIASEFKLTPKVEDTETIVPYLLQNNQTNYDFLSERAKRIGYEMLVDDKEFIFRKSQENKEPQITMMYKIDLDTFSVSLKTPTKGGEATARWWDVKNKKEMVTTASTGSGTTTMAGKVSGYELSKKNFGESSMIVLDDAAIDAADADNLVKASYNTTLKEFITGEGTCMGNPAIRAGKTVKLDGLGDRFSGIYYVVKTVHSIDDQGDYKTSFTVKRTGI